MITTTLHNFDSMILIRYTIIEKVQSFWKTNLAVFVDVQNPHSIINTGNASDMVILLGAATLNAAASTSMRYCHWSSADGDSIKIVCSLSSFFPGRAEWFFEDFGQQTSWCQPDSDNN